MALKEILTRAVLCDTEARIFEAQTLYEEGIGLLMTTIENEKDQSKKKAYSSRAKDYISRLEEITNRIRTHVKGSFLVQHLAINDDDTNKGYNTLFGSYIDDKVLEILLEEPYLQEPFQYYNMIAFLEVAVEHAPNLKYVRVITKSDLKNPDRQKTALKHIKEDLFERGIGMSYKFENTLHDRKIVLTNGYVFKVGRGLHFFKPVIPLLRLGHSNYDFRKCLQTDVDIWCNVDPAEKKKTEK